jgi:uncharacterized repeat protein (TIGR02543 family)
MTKLKHFPASGWTPFAALVALALAALAGCSNPGGEGPTTPSLTGIRAETSTDVYLQGQDLDLSAVTVTGTYSDGSEKLLPLTAGNLSGYDKTKPGEQTVTVTVEEKTAAFVVTVIADIAEAKEVLDAAVEEALHSIEAIVVSEDGSGVPEGVRWVTPVQKAALYAAIEAARELAASDDAAVETIAAALEALREAAEEVAALAENQTGTEQTWSYTVAFNFNDDGATEPAIQTVTNPATTAGSLPVAPERSGYAFTGWNTKADGSGSEFTVTTPVVADLEVYAQWTAVVNAQAPAISAQPQSASYAVGDTATALSVTASSPDGGELSYQWHRSAGGAWTAISGETSASYTPSTEAAGAAAYYARITNTNHTATGTKTASVNSSTATVTVSPAAVVNAQAPAISVQPQSAGYTVGDTATALSVAASSPDGGELSYQWHRAAGDAWTAIEGATGASYLPSTEAAGAVSYYVKVTNTNNSVNGTKTASVNSDPAMITTAPASLVNAHKPVISVQPQSASYTVGAAAAALSVTASSPDGGQLSYQWHSSTGEGWAAIAGATGASHTPSAAAAGTVSYYVKVTNTNTAVNGSQTAAENSATAIITVSPVPVVNAQAPAISVQPQSASYAVGDTATALSVAASSPDGGQLSYQWHSATGNVWTAIAGATGASYTPPAVVAGAVSYYVKVTNTKNEVNGNKTASTNSGTAVITVNPVSLVNAQAPLISVQPRGGTFFLGAAATLSVTATSPDGGELSYQWHSRANSESPWTAITGATGASYAPPTSAKGTVYYYARVTNTNNGVNGTKTASTISDAVALVIAAGKGGFDFAAWVNEDNDLISDMPEYFDIAREYGESLDIAAADDLSGIQWSLNGVDLAAPLGTARSIVIEAVRYPPGDYTLGLRAQRDDAPYSINLTFTVVN